MELVLLSGLCYGINLCIVSRKKPKSAYDSICYFALLFLLLAGIAELLNCLLHTRGSIDMFYISPWEPSTQVILRSVANRFGRGVEIVLYLCLILTGAGLIHVCSRFLSCRFSRFSSSSTD